MTSNFSVEHSLGITKQPEESCSINHDLHHKLSFFRDEIISAAKDVDYYKDDVFLVPPKKKEIKHLIGIIKQLAQWKKEWYEYYLSECCAKKVKINHDITKKYKSELVTINVLELDIQLHQSRNNINRFNDLYQQAVENIKMGYKALIEWEDKLAHCELEDESECESAIELAQSIIEGAADAFENECKTLLIPINYCVEALGPKLQKSIEKERKSILNMRKRIATSLNIKKR